MLPIALYPSEDRIAVELFGVDAPDVLLRNWPAIARILERDGLPPRDPLFGNRRFWPAVEAWLRRRNGLETSRPGMAMDGPENWDALR